MPITLEQLKAELANQEKALANAVQQANVQAGAVEMLKHLISKAETPEAKPAEETK